MNTSSDMKPLPLSAQETKAQDGPAAAHGEYQLVPEQDLSIVEEAGIAFDPTTQHIDLTKDEKRRTTALMLAIQAYKNLLIPDAAYLREASELARRGDGPQIKPATIDAMVDAAIKFDMFIGGELTSREIEVPVEDEPLPESSQDKPQG